jgi:hypothetical protein
VRALAQKMDAPLLDSIIRFNEEQKARL